MVRVIVDDRHAADLSLFLETTVGTVEAEQPFCHDVCRDAEQITGSQCGDCVCYIVLTRNGKREVADQIVALYQIEAAAAD